MFVQRENEHYDYPQLSIFRNAKLVVDNRDLMIASAKNNKDTIIYIHIPFCAKECIFCNYYKTQMTAAILDQYFSCINKELIYYSKILPPECRKISGIHFGGGTPSVVPAKYYGVLFDVINKYYDITECQISFEGNILSLMRKQYIHQIASLGINRVSFGVQTLNSKIREKYSLFSQTEKIQTVISYLQDSDINDINADLMYNFPGQTPEDVLDDGYKLFDMGINCIDLYSLIVFPNTKMFKKLVEDGDYNTYVNNQILFKKCFDVFYNDKAVHFLMSNTISKQSSYRNINLNVLLGTNKKNGGNVIGIGVSSRGYINSYKYKNYSDINYYIESVKNIGTGVQLQEIVTPFEQENRLLSMFPNFTKIPKKELSCLQNRNIKMIEALKKEQILIEDEKFLSVNPEYFFWAGNISSCFFSISQKKNMLLDVLHNRKERLNMYNQDKTNIYK